MTAQEIIDRVREVGGNIELLPDRRRFALVHRSRIPDDSLRSQNIMRETFVHCSPNSPPKRLPMPSLPRNASCARGTSRLSRRRAYTIAAILTSVASFVGRAQRLRDRTRLDGNGGRGRGFRDHGGREEAAQRQEARTEAAIYYQVGGFEKVPAESVMVVGICEGTKSFGLTRRRPSARTSISLTVLA